MVPLLAIAYQLHVCQSRLPNEKASCISKAPLTSTIKVIFPWPSPTLTHSSNHYQVPLCHMLKILSDFTSFKPSSGDIFASMAHPKLTGSKKDLTITPLYSLKKPPIQSELTYPMVPIKFELKASIWLQNPTLL